MSLGTIIVLLQMAVSLLAGSVNASPAVQQQAFTFANQAISLANEAVLAPGTPSLKEVVTTSTATSFLQFVTTDSTTLWQPAPAAISTPMEPRTISVSFALTGDDGYVTVKNDSGTAVRVKN